MQFSSAFTIILAAVSGASAVALPGPFANDAEAGLTAAGNNAPALLQARQFLGGMIGSEAVDFAQEVLDIHRGRAAERYRGRRLSQDTGSNACVSADCRRCKTTSVTIAVAEVFGCGLAALVTTIPAAIASAGTALVLEVSGFALCETTVVANYDRSLLQCRVDNP